MKVAFYIPNQSIKDVNLEHIDLGNPGIGGTEYAMLALAFYLGKMSKYDITLYVSNELNNYPLNCNVHFVNNLKDVLSLSLANQIRILVVHHSQETMDKNVFQTLRNANISIVVWIHNFLKTKYLTYYNSIDSIKRIVFVGKEFYSLYIDHEAYSKSLYIYNGVSVLEKESISYNSRSNNVTYIGNLIPGKGFHILAKAWKKVIQEVPDAVLHVIGSGKLYNRNACLGKYGLAEYRYEKKFMKYLLNKDGKPLESVKFYGILGNEKNEVLDITKVGIPNPTGFSETFGYTAVEMQMRGCLISTKKCPGYLDTVFSNGLLYSNNRQLAKCIVELLKRQSNNYSSMLEFIQENFEFGKVAIRWEEMFDDIVQGKKIMPINVDNCTSKGIKIRIFLRKMKTKYPCLKILPTYYFVYSIIVSVFSIATYKQLIRKLL